MQCIMCIRNELTAPSIVVVTMHEASRSKRLRYRDSVVIGVIHAFFVESHQLLEDVIHRVDRLALSPSSSLVSWWQLVFTLQGDSQTN
jgi:hypothetical protein